jgi:uncharacterized membrane protein
MFRSLKKYFFSGLAVFLPFALTVNVCVWILNFSENLFGKHLRKFFIENYDFYFWGLGLLLLVAIILFCGFLITNYFGRSLHRLTEDLMMRIPVMSSLYPAFKEIAKFIFREDDSGKPQQVVLVEWPGPGCFTIGFLTNKTSEAICREAGHELVNVLIPTVPNPLTGFVMMFPRARVRILSVSVEDAVKIIVSGGVVDPQLPERSHASAS